MKMMKKKESEFLIFTHEGSYQTIKLINIPLREDILIQKSIEFFHDPNPCYIHRGAVAMRLVTEIANFIGEKGNVCSCMEFPCEISSYFDIEFERVELRRE